MLLDFTNPVLDSRITFSRGTNATLVDSTGRVTYAPANMITNSVGPASSTGVTASTATGAAPDGTNAVRLTKTDATSPRYAGWNAPFTAQSNTRYVASAYFKYDGYDTTVSLEYNNVVHWGGTAWVAPFNVTASGITTDVPANCTSGVQAIGNGWFRVWAAFTTGTVSSAVTSILTRITGASGVTVLTAWGQIEAVTYQTTPGPYVATTASAYYGPRFDYDPVTLAPRGLLIEEARTNLLTYSQQFDDAAWVKLNATINANATTSPDGTVNADKLAEDATASVGHLISQGPTLTAVAHTYSVYAKASERNWICLLNNSVANVLAFFNLTTGTIGTVGSGATATITNAGNGWYRCSITFTAIAAANNCHIRLAPSDNVLSYNGVAGSGAFIYGAQLEAGAFATSYIPTVASTVSRSADVATMTGTNFSSWYNQPQGVLIANFTLDAGIPSIEGRVATISAGAVGRVVDIYSTTSWVSFNGTTFISSGVAASTSLSIVRAAAAYATGDYALSVNGAAPGTANTVLVNSPTQMTIGSFPGGSNFLNGHIRAIAYYNTRLPNTQLQTLTAPSLASPLALDFISPTYTVGY
jgi:hypothetical protein